MANTNFLGFHLDYFDELICLVFFRVGVLCNSPSVFQRYINTVFNDLIKNKVIWLYLDDIIIPSMNEEENLEKLKLVFTKAE